MVVSEEIYYKGSLTMKKTKAFLASFLALASVLSMTACGGKEESSNPYADVDVTADVRNKIKENVMNTDLLPSEELEN